MARYFFDVADHVVDFDETGTECADLDAAKREAVAVAAAYLRDHLDARFDDQALKVSVRDEIGTELVVIEISVADPERH